MERRHSRVSSRPFQVTRTAATRRGRVVGVGALAACFPPWAVPDATVLVSKSTQRCAVERTPGRPSEPGEPQADTAPKSCPTTVADGKPCELEETDDHVDEHVRHGH